MEWKKQGLSDEEIRLKPFKINNEKIKNHCYKLGLSFCDFNLLFRKNGSITKTLKILMEKKING